MAEYVRRKRPPASHPYWARLHDRAHPPAFVIPIAIFGGIGALLGLCGGSIEPMPMARAVKLATTLAAGLAAVLFATSVPVLLLDASRYMPRRERWPVAVVSGLAVSAVAFFVFLLLFIPLALWFSLSSGLGAWLGLLTGFAVGATPAAIFAIERRRRWHKRQRDWPRWERMRARHRRVRGLAIPALPAPAEPAPSAEPEPDRPEGRRAAE